ncbi:unnamed protein product [Owenia fusiformis]|uniref:Solute carrier family 66 member 3 n=1 Tax=Owenia fusiformis TaxID=6347 RepID=A0A8J1UEH2_OWEFU|nr:unnamed protein product [Owenia fusiformis]
MSLVKLLGYSTVVSSSLLLKFPQLLKIHWAGSGQGVSLYSILVDALSSGIFVAYCIVNQYPFSSWGESLFLALEGMLIAILILWYSNQKSYIGGLLLGYVVCMCLMVSPYITIPMHTAIQSCVTPFVMSGKFTQIKQIYSNGGPGQLSYITVTFMNYRSWSRLLTSVMETADIILVTKYGFVSLANSVIALQCIYYANTGKLKTK